MFTLEACEIFVLKAFNSKTRAKRRGRAICQSNALRTLPNNQQFLQSTKATREMFTISCVNACDVIEIMVLFLYKATCKWLTLLDQLERAKRFELSTLTLARLCSTPELRPRPFGEDAYTSPQKCRKGKITVNSFFTSNNSCSDKGGFYPSNSTSKSLAST